MPSCEAILNLFRHDSVCGPYLAECKAFLLLALPTVLFIFEVIKTNNPEENHHGQAAYTTMQQLLFTISIAFVGHVSKEAMDGVALAISIINVCACSVVGGVLSAFQTFLSQAYGSTNKKMVGVWLQKGLILALLTCFPCWGVLLNIQPALLLLGQDPEVARLGQEYIMMFLPGLPGYALHTALSTYLLSQGKAFPSMMVGTVGALLHAGQTALLVSYWNLGAAGAGIAVSLTYWSLALLHILYIRVSRVYEATWGGFDVEACLAGWGSFMAVGLPAMLLTCLQWWFFEVLVLLAGMLGTTELGAFTVGFQLQELVFQLISGFSSAVCVRVGYFLGKEEPESAKTSARVVVVSIVVTDVVLVGALILLRNDIAPLFTSDSGVRQLLKETSLDMCIFIFFDHLEYVCNGVLRGMGQQAFGLWVSGIAYYVLGLPVAWALMFRSPLRSEGAWLSGILAKVFQNICNFTKLYFINWEKESEKAQVRSNAHPTTKDQNSGKECESAGEETATEGLALLETARERETAFPYKLLFWRLATLGLMFLLLVLACVLHHFLSALP